MTITDRREETMAETKTVGDAVAVVAQYPGGVTAANVGESLWNTRPDEINPARYARPAGKLLRKAKAEGRVREEYRGNQRLWFVR
jgi:hypothetical protein